MVRELFSLEWQAQVPGVCMLASLSERILGIFCKSVLFIPRHQGQVVEAPA